MKIAVTYENGQIFQHFGHSESFKIYEAEGKNIVRAEVIGTDGAGHSALAAVLKDKGVDVLICGGIGNGAVTALSEAVIDVYSGADGEAYVTIMKKVMAADTVEAMKMKSQAADTVEAMKVNQTVVVVVAAAAVAVVHLHHHLKDLMWERR